jgi:ABC-type iron transport system FetAB permease component
MQQLDHWLAQTPLFPVTLLLYCLAVGMAIRRILRHDNFRRKILWIAAGLISPTVILINGSDRFRHKILWSLAALIGPDVTLAYGAKLILAANLAVTPRMSVSIGAGVALLWWLTAPRPATVPLAAVLGNTDEHG